MYQVFCRSPKRSSRWSRYSGLCQTREEAEVIQARAADQHYLDLDGNELLYKVKAVGSPAVPLTGITKTVTELSAHGVVCKAVFAPSGWQDDFIAVFGLGELTEPGVNEIAGANETCCIFRH